MFQVCKIAGLWFTSSLNSFLSALQWSSNWIFLISSLLRKGTLHINVFCHRALHISISCCFKSTGIECWVFFWVRLLWNTHGFWGVTKVIKYSVASVFCLLGISLPRKYVKQWQKRFFFYEFTNLGTAPWGQDWACTSVKPITSAPLKCHF